MSASDGIRYKQLDRFEADAYEGECALCGLEFKDGDEVIEVEVIAPGTRWHGEVRQYCAGCLTEEDLS